MFAKKTTAHGGWKPRCKFGQDCKRRGQDFHEASYFHPTNYYHNFNSGDNKRNWKSRNYSLDTESDFNDPGKDEKKKLSTQSLLEKEEKKKISAAEEEKTRLARVAEEEKKKKADAAMEKIRLASAADEKEQTKYHAKFKQYMTLLEHNFGGPARSTAIRPLVHYSIHQNLLGSTTLPLTLVNIIEQYLVGDQSKPEGRRECRSSDYGSGDTVRGSFNNGSASTILLIDKIFEKIKDLIRSITNSIPLVKSKWNFSGGSTALMVKDDEAIRNALHNDVRMIGLVNDLIDAHFIGALERLEKNDKNRYMQNRQQMYGDKIAISGRCSYSDQYGGRYGRQYDYGETDRFFCLHFYFNGTSVCGHEDISSLDFPSSYWLNLNNFWMPFLKKGDGDGKEYIDTGESYISVKAENGAGCETIDAGRYGYTVEIVCDSLNLPVGIAPLLLEKPGPTKPERFTGEVYNPDTKITETGVPPPLALEKEVYQDQLAPLHIWKLSRSVEGKDRESRESFYLVTKNTTQPSVVPVRGMILMSHHCLSHLFFSQLSKETGELMGHYDRNVKGQFLFPQYDHWAISYQMTEQLFKIMFEYKISPHRLFIEGKG
jgi:hypothetical protein